MKSVKELLPEASDEMILVQARIDLKLKRAVDQQIKIDKARHIKTTWKAVIEMAAQMYLQERKRKVG